MASYLIGKMQKLSEFVAPSPARQSDDKNEHVAPLSARQSDYKNEHMTEGQKKKQEQFNRIWNNRLQHSQPNPRQLTREEQRKLEREEKAITSAMENINFPTGGITNYSPRFPNSVSHAARQQQKNFIEENKKSKLGVVWKKEVEDVVKVDPKHLYYRDVNNILSTERGAKAFVDKFGRRRRKPKPLEKGRPGGGKRKKTAKKRKRKKRNKTKKRRKVPLSIIFGNKLSKKERMKKWKTLKQQKSIKKKTRKKKKRTRGKRIHRKRTFRKPTF